MPFGMVQMCPVLIGTHLQTTGIVMPEGPPSSTELHGSGILFHVLSGQANSVSQHVFDQASESYYCL